MDFNGVQIRDDWVCNIIILVACSVRESMIIIALNTGGGDRHTIRV